tara:strand:- start:4 stop:348 length:345 start_codon:yes stop_codon:yes gene_type:complete
MVVEYPGSSTYEMKINDILINYTEDITKFNKKVKDLKGIKKRIKNNESKKKKLIFEKKKELTYKRGNHLLNKKIEELDYWIDYLYFSHKILIVILVIIIIVSLIYKKLNSKFNL